MGKSWEQIYAKVSQAAEEVKKKSREGKLLSQREAALVREKALYDRLEKGNVIVATKPLEPEKNTTQQKNVPPVAPAKKTPAQTPVTAVPSPQPTQQPVVPQVPVQARVSGREAAAFMSTQYVAPSDKTTQEIADLYATPSQPPQTIPQNTPDLSQNTQNTEKDTDAPEVVLQNLAQEAQQVQVAQPQPEPQPDPLTQKTPDNTAPDHDAQNEQLQHTPEKVTKRQRTEWWEVERKSDVFAIEDLGGSMKMFEKHVQDCGFAQKGHDGSWYWTGKDQKVVFLGDILGDRKMDGVAITGHINDLAQQAEKEGGSVEMLVGNHEMFMLDFLMRYKEDDVMRTADLYTLQNTGTWELAQFDPAPDAITSLKNPLKKGSLTDNDIWMGLYRRLPAIREHMRTSAEGKKFIENLCKMKIATIQDDVLYFHTNVTLNMVKDLLKNGNAHDRVEEINCLFQDELRNNLYNDKSVSDEFIRTVDLYIDTYNRTDFLKKYEPQYVVNRISGVIFNTLKESDKVFLKPQWQNDVRLSDVYDDDGSRMMISHIDVDEDLIRADIHEFSQSWEINPEGLAEKVVEYFLNYTQENKRIEIFHDLEKLIEEKTHVVSMTKQLRDQGINAIFHGHTPGSGFNEYDVENFVIGTPHGKNDGILTVHTDGSMEIGKNGKMIHDVKPQNSVTQSDPVSVKSVSSKKVNSPQPIMPQQPPQQPLQPEQKVDTQKIEQGIKKIGDELGINVQYDQITNDPDAEAIVDKVHRALAAADHETMAKVFDVVALMTKETNATSGGDKLLLQYTLPQQEMVASIDRVTQEAIQKQRDALVKKYNIPPQYGEVFRNAYMQIKKKKNMGEKTDNFFRVLKALVEGDDLSEEQKLDCANVEYEFLVGKNDGSKDFDEDLIDEFIVEDGKLLIIFGSPEKRGNDQLAENMFGVISLII